MNRYQELWWTQVRADHRVLVLLRNTAQPAGHQLHYLQMVSEKLGKAYFWRTPQYPPPRSHASFVQFLRSFGSRSRSDRALIAQCLGFGRGDDLDRWVPTVVPLAYRLEQLAPSLAGEDGPNPEYPWPHAAPEHCPATFAFPVWEELKTGRGRHLLRVLDAAVQTFPQYA